MRPLYERSCDGVTHGLKNVRVSIKVLDENHYSLYSVLLLGRGTYCRSTAPLQ